MSHKGNIDRSIADATRANEIDPKSVTAHVNRANSYLHKDDFDEAIADATKAIEIAPNNANATTIGVLLTFAKAITTWPSLTLPKRSKSIPHLAHVYAYRAEAYKRKADQDRGIADNTQSA